MNNAKTAHALAALGHEARLNIFRILVKAGDDGLIVGDIANHVQLPLSTLAHHLRTLVEAGLVEQERNGREVINRADYTTMNAVLAFVTAECCAGVRLISEDAA